MVTLYPMQQRENISKNILKMKERSTGHDFLKIDSSRRDSKDPGS